jgi:hypothetical protein
VTLKGKIYLITFLSLVLLVVLNEVNLSFLQGNFPYKDGLITTADEYSYFAPADTFLDHFKWAESSDGRPAFMRTPGYSVIYLLSRLIGGTYAFLILKIIQILLFGGSILLLAKILQLLHVREWLILLFTAIYGLMPCFSGFVYYTLSESVIPFFVLWSLNSVLRQSFEQKLSWSVAVSLACLTLIRPQLVVLPLTFLALVLFRGQRKTAISIVLSFVPLLIWQLRTFSIEGKLTDFHPIYSVSNNSLYRPPHQAMTDLFRLWDCRGDVFHNNMALLSRDTLSSTRKEVLETIPGKFHSSVEPLLLKFQQFRMMQREEYSGRQLNDYLPGEKELVDGILRKRTELIREYPLDHYVKTPVLSTKKLLGTSMMNLFVFQDPWRNNLLVIALKFLSFGLTTAGILAMIHVILFHVNVTLRLSAIAVLLSLFYLCFVQRFNEERYLTPYLSLLLIFLAVSVNRYLPAENKKGG